MRIRSRSIRTAATGRRGTRAERGRRRLDTEDPDPAAGRASAPDVGGGSPRYPEIRFCQAVMYFSLFKAAASMLCALSSIAFVGKISVFFAIEGSPFSSTSFAPTTGQM